MAPGAADAVVIGHGGFPGEAEGLDQVEVHGGSFVCRPGRRRTF
jgi:hypothetical protein